ncbi:MAG: acyl carrier protein [Oscillospiraceae bacterium]|nr:acyl carrier protein [Oscillospiraceae bacterium]
MVYEKLRAIIADQLGIDADDIGMDTHILNDLGADSLDLVELIMALEDEFNLVITDETARELYTVREITEFIEKLI